MNKIISLAFAFVLGTFANGQDKNSENMHEWKYEIDCAGIANKGGSLLKVYTYAKSRKIAIEEAKKSAVHGILFKGYIGNSKCSETQRAMVSNPMAEAENRDFFNTFFADGGRYMKYVTLSTDGNMDTDSVVKVGKEYKLGIIVTVAKDALRRDLEAAGIIKNIADRY